MPATDRLLTKLQQMLGEGPTGDLVAWVNEVGAVSRAEVRDIADLYLSRFDERLERRLAETRAELQTELRTQVTDLRRDMETGFARLETRVEQRTADIMKWSFAFWAGSVLFTVGALAALARLLP